MKQILQRKTQIMSEKRLTELIMIVLVILILVMGSGLLVSCGTERAVLDSPKYHIPQKLKKDLVRESQPFSQKRAQSESK